MISTRMLFRVMQHVITTRRMFLEFTIYMTVVQGSLKGGTLYFSALDVERDIERGEIDIFERRSFSAISSSLKKKLSGSPSLGLILLTVSDQLLSVSSGNHSILLPSFLTSCGMVASPLDLDIELSVHSFLFIVSIDDLRATGLDISVFDEQTPIIIKRLYKTVGKKN